MKDMNETELRETEGGMLPLLYTLAGAGIGSIISGWADFKRGYLEGYQFAGGHF